MKIGPVGADLFHAYKDTDWRKGMRKLMFAFRNFAKALKNHKRIDHLETLK